MHPLEIKVHRIEGKRILVQGRTVTVQCVDGQEYTREFDTEKEAVEAVTLIAIFPSEWRKADHADQ